MILESGAFAHHIERFNAMEDEPIVQLVPNAKAWEWLVTNAPLFECPDMPSLPRLTTSAGGAFRKHIKQTPHGRILTEFLASRAPCRSVQLDLLRSGAPYRGGHAGSAIRRFSTSTSRSGFAAMTGKPQPHFHKFSGWTARRTGGPWE